MKIVYLFAVLFIVACDNCEENPNGGSSNIIIYQQSIGEQNHVFAYNIEERFSFPLFVGSIFSGMVENKIAFIRSGVPNQSIMFTDAALGDSLISMAFETGNNKVFLSPNSQDLIFINQSGNCYISNRDGAIIRISQDAIFGNRVCFSDNGELIYLAEDIGGRIAISQIDRQGNKLNESLLPVEHKVSNLKDLDVLLGEVIAVVSDDISSVVYNVHSNDKYSFDFPTISARFTGLDFVISLIKPNSNEIKFYSGNVQIGKVEYPNFEMVNFQDWNNGKCLVSTIFVENPLETKLAMFEVDNSYNTKQNERVISLNSTSGFWGKP